MPSPKRGARKPRRTPTRAQWMRDFLAALAETSNVTAAAEKARITLSHVYKTRRSDSAFARKWLSALCEGYDNLELELWAQVGAADFLSPQEKRALLGLENLENIS